MSRTLLLIGFLFFSIYSFGQSKVLSVLPESSIRGVQVFGKPVDNQTRCIHWHSDLDIIAIKFKCCDKYYPCFSCHEEEADHEHQVWPKSEYDQKAILCGVCGTELSIQDYMSSNNTCPKCQSAFNPGCSKHYHLYFDEEKKEID
ncbi:CHY zinc finger protein [Algoriphagus formosus]|uniref:CHY zinc finger protein n=1 Tax=Algoriphagus formosus TaxID=2007308 RepID=UPI000C28AE1C|nr:CHY zinc finger protein [Algoriphagus formosus]